MLIEGYTKMSQIQLRTGDWPPLLQAVGLTPEEILRLCVLHKLKQREGKVHLPTFLTVLLGESVNRSPSLNDLAAKMEATDHIGVSKQAVGDRINESCVNVVQAMIARALTARFSDIEKVKRLLCGKYRRVLIQDSTVIQLPARLFAEYSGVANGHTQVCNARIQFVYDLLSGEFIDFSIDPYSKNDLKAAPELKLQKGDLALRDRGYLIYDEIQRHITEGADCLYRHKLQNLYLDPQTEEPIDLAELLKREGRIDREVLLNNPSRTRVRLLAAPVDQETANRRRQKLKKETKGRNPSQELLFLQSWTIFITTVSAEVASFDQLLAMYGLRWRIENIFKAWKSHWHFAQIHNVSQHQLQVLLLSRLIALVLLNRCLYLLACERIRKTYDRILSLMKFTRYLECNPDRKGEILQALSDPQGRHPVLDALARYCTYDKRQRLNFVQKTEACFDSWSLG